MLAGILGPLSLLTAIYATNFTNIPGTGKLWGFWIFVGVQAHFVALSVWYLSRRGLL